MHGFGDISIRWNPKRPVMRFSHSPALTGDLEHWQYDTFQGSLAGPESGRDAL